MYYLKPPRKKCQKKRGFVTKLYMHHLKMVRHILNLDTRLGFVRLLIIYSVKVYDEIIRTHMLVWREREREREITRERQRQRHAEKQRQRENAR